MIDLKDLRERPEVYRANMKKKGRNEKIVSDVLELDEQWREVKLKADKLRHERNSISEQINQAKKKKADASSLIRKAREIPEKLKDLETEEKDLYESLSKRLLEIPNLMHPQVPVGKSEKNNKVRKVVGAKTKLKFPARTHVELIESLDLGDFDASAKVAGHGFYYLKKDLALLNRALINFAVDFMEKKGYEYIEPSLMVNKRVEMAKGDFKAFENALYKIEGEDLYLIPTAEDAILGMLADKTIPEEKLPLKFFGYSMSFRKEIGSHGINEKGLWRTHQFNKVEQFIFCKPKDSWKYYEELRKNAEEIIKKLKLPYRILEMCTADLGDWKARTEDIEVWRPTTKTYGEVGSLSNCTDYQARDLNIRGISKKGERYVLHTLNNTALATSRIMVAILENFQQKDGSIKIPAVLQKYMGGKKKIIAGKKK
ncbi:MAG TPA: serine--tRNA ligase [Candidatus Nanoarchaeia archaeon]|nr:serine--tRNA ligase [Candidatus Nanoarchaeia archaeon]